MCEEEKFCVVGARVDDIAVLTVQCDAQQLFLAMTGSRKKEDYTGFTSSLFFCDFLFYTKSTQRGGQR
jgi:hypothetical protein